MRFLAVACRNPGETAAQAAVSWRWAPRPGSHQIPLRADARRALACNARRGFRPPWQHRALSAWRIRLFSKKRDWRQVWESKRCLLALRSAMSATGALPFNTPGSHSNSEEFSSRLLSCHIHRPQAGCHCHPAKKKPVMSLGRCKNFTILSDRSCPTKTRPSNRGSMYRI